MVWVYFVLMQVVIGTVGYAVSSEDSDASNYAN
jgi:hypothetical protein